MFRNNSICSRARFEAIIAFLLYEFTFKEDAKSAKIEISQSEKIKIPISTSIIENANVLLFLFMCLNSLLYMTEYNNEYFFVKLPM